MLAQLRRAVRRVRPRQRTGMILLPAIDILDGKAVRLTRGEFDQRTVYDADPLDAARRWVDEGARSLHVVDLDGARSGAPVNLEHVGGSPRSSTCPSRSAAACGRSAPVAMRSQAGVARVVIGTAAYRGRRLPRRGARRVRRPRRGLDRRARRSARGARLDRADRDPDRVGDRAARAPAGCAGSSTRASSATACWPAPTSTSASPRSPRPSAAPSSIPAASPRFEDLERAGRAAPGQPDRRDRRQGAVRAAVLGRRHANGVLDG